MGWIITKDHLFEAGAPGERSRVGYGPGTKSPDTTPIKLYDDDGSLYYEGLIDTRDLFDAKAPQGAEFAPLDFAQADAGCTEMRFFYNEKWEVL